MFWTVYRGPPTPPLKWWEIAIGTVVVIGMIFVWAIGALITRNGDWLDKYIPKAKGTF